MIIREGTRSRLPTGFDHCSAPHLQKQTLLCTYLSAVVRRLAAQVISGMAASWSARRVS